MVVELELRLVAIASTILLLMDFKFRSYDQNRSCQFRVLYFLLYNLPEYKRKECVGSIYMVRINYIYVYSLETYFERVSVAWHG